MSFKNMLKDIVENVEGGVGAIVMGYDGIPIDDYIKENIHLDVQLMAIEYASILKEIKRTIEVLKTGVLEEVSIASEKSYVTVRVVSEDFFLALVLTHDGNFGKGRYLLKRDVAKINEALM
jgi:predicted regulator of Ras-like GTPase activity (Roadblock/LC7/MglB family)